MLSQKIGLGLVVLALSASAAQADLLDGTVVRVEGRKNSSCRMIGVKRADQTVIYFRLPSTSDGDAMVSVALTALVSRLPIQIQYTATPSTTCGGGAEPDIEIIAIKSN